MRCLTKPIMFRPERASRIAASCATLHNFAIHNRLELGEEYDRGILDQIRNEEEVGGNHGNERGGAREQLVQRIFTKPNWIVTPNIFVKTRKVNFARLKVSLIYIKVKNTLFIIMLMIACSGMALLLA